jgi:hypothetical protein
MGLTMRGEPYRDVPTFSGVRCRSVQKEGPLSATFFILQQYKARVNTRLPIPSKMMYGGRAWRAALKVEALISGTRA